MKKIGLIYSFITAYVASLILNLSFTEPEVFIYFLMTIIISFCLNYTAYTWLGLMIIMCNHSIFLIFYTILGYILFVAPASFPADKKNKTITGDLLDDTFPFYLLIMSATFIRYIDSITIFSFYLFTLLMFITRKHLAAVICFGILILSVSETSFFIVPYLIAYIATIFYDKRIKKEKIENITIENTTTINIAEANNSKKKFHTLAFLINDLTALKKNIVDININARISNILKTCNIINEIADEDNNHKVNKLINYYAPELINILEDYVEIEKTQLISEENAMFKVNVMKIVEHSEKAFNKILQSMLDTTIKKSNIDIKVLEKMLKEENLL